MATFQAKTSKKNTGGDQPQKVKMTGRKTRGNIDGTSANDYNKCGTCKKVVKSGDEAVSCESV